MDRQGQPWKPEETLDLHDSFVRMTPVEQIAKEHGRTINAIVARLVLMGLIVEIPNQGGYFRIGESFYSWRDKPAQPAEPVQEPFLNRKPLPPARVVRDRDEDPPF